MNELKKYVDELFKNYGTGKDISDLREEVLSNLEAKAKDLISEGKSEKEAIRIAKKSITDIDCLIDGNRKIYINKYKLEYMQIGLMYLLIAWIVTIPITIEFKGILINNILFIGCIVTGIAYFIHYSKKENINSGNIEIVNINSALKTRKVAWVMWGLFISVSALYITALQFGSNIWFGRSININGPYELAEIGLRYFMPFISIIIPIFLGKAPKLINKYEAGDDNEYN